jgi:hypothetical protein
MPTIFLDRLCVDDAVYTIDAYPLEPYLASLRARPLVRPSPFRRNGYVATWSVVDDALYLAELTCEPMQRLFANTGRPIHAIWFSGLIHGWRGDRRTTGYPPHPFFDDEIVLEIASGMVTRTWVLDLRALPDQTDEELRQSLSQFLWPARLRDA